MTENGLLYGKVDWGTFLVKVGKMDGSPFNDIHYLTMPKWPGAQLSGMILLPRYVCFHCDSYKIISLSTSTYFQTAFFHP